MNKTAIALWCTATFALAPACVSAPSRPDVAFADALAAEAAGDSAAPLTLARLVGRHGRQAAPLSDGLAAARRSSAPEARLWEAVFCDALGRDAEAFNAWLRLVATPEAPDALVAVAAIAATALVDRAPLVPVAPATLDPAAPLRAALVRPGAAGVRAAEALEAVALRLPDATLRAELVALARDRLGPIPHYQLLGLVDPLPALGRPQPSPTGPVAPRLHDAPAAPGPPVVASPAGRVGLPPASHGVFAILVPTPAAGPVELEIITDAAVRVFADGRLVASHPALTTPLPRRLRALVDAPPSRLLEVHLAARAFPSAPRVLVRPAPAAARASAPDDRVDPPDLLDLPDLPDPIAAALATLIVALADTAPEPLGLAGPPAALDPAVPLHALWLARAALADPGRPGPEARSEVAGLLDGALAADGDLAAARAERVRALYDDGDAPNARALAAAGPLGDHADRLALLGAEAAGVSPRAAVDRLRARLPTSCEAVTRWLEAHWEALKLRAEPLPPLPGCFELRLRAASLLLEARRLDDAADVLTALALDATPGAEAARVGLGRGRLALARGQLPAAADHARAALATGAEQDAALEMLMRAAILGRDAAMVQRTMEQLETDAVSPLLRRRALVPARDLGLPLADGLAIARSVRVPAEDGGGPEHPGRDGEDGEDSDDGEADAPRPGAEAAVGAAVGSYEVLRDDWHTRVYPDGTQLHRVHRVVRLLEANAVDAFGEIDLPEEAEVLLARTWKPTGDGQWQPIEPEELPEKSTISLPALARGALAEVAWFWFQAPDPRFAPGWRAPVFRFASDRGPTRFARFVLQAPPDAPLDIVTEGDAPAPTRPAPGVLVFEARDRPRVLPEPLDPRPDRRLPGVRVASGVDPERVVARLRDTVASGLMSSPALRALAAEAVAGVSPDASGRARLEALHGFVVTRIRDIDEAPVLARAAHAAVRRSGERAVLLTALCGEVGLDCELALVRTLASGPLDARVFEPETYLYPVVRARVDGAPGGEVWLDTASRFVPFAYLPPLVQASDALALGAGPARVTTPRTDEATGARAVEIVLTLSEDGAHYAARGEERIDGVFGQSWREALLELTPERREAVLGTIVQQSLPGGRVERVTTSALEARGEALTVRWEAHGALTELAPGRTALSLALAPERIERATVLLPERATPLFINRAVRLEVQITVVLPDGVALGTLPAPLEVAHPLLAFARAAVRVDAGRAVRLTKTFRLDPGIVPPDAYEAWKRAARDVDRADLLQLVFDATPNVLSTAPRMVPR